ncbi:MAG: type 4a pilus biogenesis protein PilO [Candidatus Omnitrophota bacterium]
MIKDKLFYNKFRNTLVLITVLSIACISMAILILMGLYMNHCVTLNTAGIEKDLQKYVNAYGVAPDEVVEKQEFIKKDLKQKYDEYAAIFSSQAESEQVISPLVFKERLFGYEDRVRSKAAKNGVLLPASLGFKEFELEVPPQSQSLILSRELFAAEELLLLLIKDGISAINKIELVHELKQSIISTFPVKMSFDADFEVINKFFKDLSDLNTVYIVKEMTIEQKEDHPKLLTVGLELEYNEIRK